MHPPGLGNASDMLQHQHGLLCTVASWKTSFETNFVVTLLMKNVVVVVVVFVVRGKIPVSFHGTNLYISMT